jgi:hypothetical protein
VTTGSDATKPANTVNANANANTNTPTPTPKTLLRRKKQKQKQNRPLVAFDTVEVRSSSAWRPISPPERNVGKVMIVPWT